MDSLTQAALGAVVGERILGSRLGRSAIGWGALVGTLPDLDILLYPWLDPIAELYWHRGFSHSIAGILVGTPLVAWLLFLLWNRETALKRRSGSRISLQLALLFVFLNFASHILIDCFTVYGTQLLEPFSNQRFGLNNLFIIDPLFTLPLLIWIAAALFSRRTPGVAPRGWVPGCSVFLVLYLGFSFAAQATIGQRFERELAEKGINPIRGFVAPAPFTTAIWRGLYETEDAFWIGYGAISDNDEPLVFKKITHQRNRLKPFENDRTIECALWFSEDYLLVEPSPEGGFLVTDMRFVEFWPDDTNGMPRTFFSWHVIPESMEGGPVFTPVRNSRPDLAGLIDTMQARFRGDRTAFLPK